MRPKSVSSPRSKTLAALPRFAPEYAADLAVFTRRFLRAFFALFPPQSVLVIDNFHEAPADAAWRYAFSEGLRELPVGLNLIVLSRMPPPPESPTSTGKRFASPKKRPRRSRARPICRRPCNRRSIAQAKAGRPASC